MPGTTLPQWLLAAPGAVLATLAALVVVRVLVDRLAGDRDAGIVLRSLRFVTDLVLVPVRSLTPRIVPAPLVGLFAVSWLIVARMLWLLAAAALGLRVSFGG